MANLRASAGRPSRLPFSTRLALRQLRYKGMSLAGVFAGVCVAIVLVFVQLGFAGALVNSVLNLGRALDADLFISGEQFETIAYSPPWFARDILYRAEATPDVVNARPFYAFINQIRDPATGRPLAARFMAFDPARPAFRQADIRGNAAQLSYPNSVLIDSRSRQGFRAIVERVQAGGTETIYLQNPAATLAPRVDVRGTFELGPDFTLPGSVVTSDLNFYRLLRLPLDRVSLGLVSIRPGADPIRVRDALHARLGNDARIFTRDEFIKNESDYFLYETPIGVIFLSGILIGVVIGVVFIFNLLHGIIQSNLSEYAVLRALGYEDRFFTVLVVQIAALVSVVAFIPSIVLTLGIYSFVGWQTQLQFQLTITTCVIVFVATLLMSVVAVLFAIRKLKSSNPLDLFS